MLDKEKVTKVEKMLKEKPEIFAYYSGGRDTPYLK